MGDALYEDADFLRAEHHYRQAMVACQQASHTPDSLRVILQLVRCLKARGETAEAITLLKSISATTRTPAMSNLLGGMLAKSNPKEAIEAYKEVLRIAPLALDALQAAISLGEAAVYFFRHHKKARHLVKKCIAAFNFNPSPLLCFRTGMTSRECVPLLRHRSVSVADETWYRDRHCATYCDNDEC